MSKPRAIAACVVMLALGAAVGAGAAALADAPRKRIPTPSTKPKRHGLLLLNRKKQYPASVIPRVRRARNADRLDGRAATAYQDRCPPRAVNMGTWCIDASPYPVRPEDAGKNDYFYATRKCGDEGGFLPGAEQLLAAVDRVKLASTIDDSRLTASIDEDPTDGRKDRVEMSSSLFVIRGGSAAAGSVGVSPGSTGNPKTGEPNPVPQPSDPHPESLHYATVYDNRNNGGFGGSKPVGQPENFRCAYLKSTVNRESDEG